MKIANLISRVVIGVVFIFSGFVKAVDPLGSVYKFNDYFTAFGMSWMEPLSMTFAVFMCALEFVVGFAILFGLRYKLSSLGGLLFMLFFTPLTLYIALTNPVSDCGCFGDALIMSNNATFIKNIFILAAAIIVFLYRNKFKSYFNDKMQWGLLAFSIVFIGFIMLHSYRHLPILDFRPWKVGNNISELVTPTPEVADIYLVYKNKTTGEQKEYPVNNYPWNDPEWVANWEFVDQKKVVTQEYQKAPVSDFVILDEFGDDLTESIMGNTDYHFLLFAYDLGKTATKKYKKINEFAQNAETDGYAFVGLTATPYSFTDNFRHEHQIMFPFYLVDEIALKTAVRANPGLILLKEGVVIAKWHHNDIPEFQKVKAKYFK